MKANKAITIALAGILTACAIPFGTVFAAAESTTDYPAETTDETSGKVIKPFERELEIESVTDYAVYGDNFAYASGLTITILSLDGSGDRKKLQPYTHGYSVKKLDYDESGNLYFQNSSDISYQLNVSYQPNVSASYRYDAEPKEHEFQSIDSSMPIMVDTGYYTLNSTNGDLQYWKDGVPSSLGEGFSIIKKYGDHVYAMKDGTVPYKIDEAEKTQLDLSYTDFDEAGNILCGEAAAKLAAGRQLTTANIGSGTYYTQIDADDIGKGATDVFKPKTSDGKIEGSTKKAEGDKPCLVLCKSGNTAVVVTDEGMFITSTENLKKESHYSPPNNDWSASHAYVTAKTGVYTSPYMCDSTWIADLESGAENAVEVVERFELDFISTKFYKVSYEDKETGKQISGFVAANMLTPYDFKAEDKEPHENGDEKFNYDTNVVSVVLAIIIVALVIVAIMYISLVGTKKNKDKGEKKAKAKAKREPEQIENYNEDEE